MMAEVITVFSSDEEESSPPRKKAKLITLSKEVPAKVVEDNIVMIDLSDDEEDAPVQQQTPTPPPEGKHVPVIQDVVSWNGGEDLKEEEEKVEPDSTIPCKDSDGPSAVLDTNSNNIDHSENSLDETANLNHEEKLADVVNGDEPVASSNANNKVQNKLYTFLDDCLKALTNPSHKDQLSVKIATIKKYFEKLTAANCDFTDLLEIINGSNHKIVSSQRAVIYFANAYRWLKSETVAIENKQLGNLKHENIIKKLEKTLLKVRYKIRQLEEAEVDFDEDNNSSYIQLSRYKERAHQIYKKLCTYHKEDPNFGRLMFMRLDFARSNYSEINQALNRKYKNNMDFPTFYDVDKCVRKCVTNKDLKISESKLKVEIKYCFEELGNLMQRRRKLELCDVHTDYLTKDGKDPADENSDIERKLKASASEGHKKMQEVIEKYTALQEKGVNPEVSSESDDSNVPDSGDEDEDQ